MVASQTSAIANDARIRDNRKKFMSKKLTPIAATMLVAFSSPLMSAPAQAQATSSGAQSSLPQVTVKERASESEIKIDQSASIKMTAPILDTPKSITVIPAQVINQTGATSLSEALRTTPGITFAAGEGGTPIGDRPLIRGFDAQSSTFVDGVRDVGSQSRDMFNLDAIEVTRGADSTTSGRGGAGGSINLISKTPKKENFTEGSIGLGSANYKRLVADGNYLFGDNAAVRLNGMFTDTGVAGRPSVTSKSWGFAPAVRFGLDGPTAVTLSYYHLQADDMPDYSTPYRNSLTRSKANPDGPVSVGRQFYGLNNRDFRNTQADIGTLQVQHDFGNALIVRNTTRYGKTGNDYIVTNPDDSAGNIRNGLVYRSPKTRIASTTTVINQTDLSGEFVTGDIKHKFVTGLELGQEKSQIGGYTVFPNAAFTSRVCGAAGGPTAGSYNCTSLFNPNPDDAWSGRIVESPNVTKTKVNTKAVYVFDNHDGVTTRLQFAYGCTQHLHDDRRQSFADLVEQQQAGPSAQNTRNRQHLLLPAGEPGAGTVAPLPQVGEHAVNFLHGHTVAGDHRRQQQVFFRAEAGENPAFLRAVTDAEVRNLVGGKCDRLASVDHDRAAALPGQPEHCAQRRSAARAIAAEQSHHFAAIDVEIDAVQHMGFAIKRMQAGDPQHFAVGTGLAECAGHVASSCSDPTCSEPTCSEPT